MQVERRARAEELRDSRPWVRLEQLHTRAVAFPLDILVWGPAESDSLEYRKRCEIRDSLNADGHHAAFSEDKMPPDSEAWDPLDAEFLQADTADLIIVLYGSRGTQSEVDTLLLDERFAAKAAIFIDASQHDLVKRSVSKGTWEKLARRSYGFVEFSPDELERSSVVAQAMGLAKKARIAAFVSHVKAAARR
jgi:hypothetical protein